MTGDADSVARLREGRTAGHPVSDEQTFDLSQPLPEGVTVLEASAGTGKTFTIAALAARFVAEGMPLEQLLLVTFTRAATSELRERVRERLVLTERELARIQAGAPPSGEDPLVGLLSGGEASVVELRRERLASAIANFDAATIETTHGFCQKVLDELGTLGDLEPDMTFVERIDDLVEEVVDDLYVRRFFNARGGFRLDREEAGEIARIAIDNPTAPVHPLEAQADSPAAMRVRLAKAARQELERRKRELALMTHDDQLTRLLATLTGTNGPQAAAMLRRRYRVVLIDEFQDTDPVQWEIVRTAFDGDGVRLVLIGDPKQAIYAFRGADVYAYLAAARTANRRATLGTNHRSDQGLLDGLDALFGNARLGHPGIVYRRVRAAPGNRSSRLHGAPCELPLRLRLVDGADPEITRTPGGWPSAPSVRDLVARDLSADAVRLLNSEARIERRRADGSTIGHTTVAPGHLAVLVSTHRQARLIQEALDSAGIPAVINGSGSVFATSAATDWRILLEALERPSSPPRARAAALTPFLGVSAAAITAAGEDELEQLHRRLYAWARVLREHGVATLTRTILLGQRVPGRLLRLHDGERYLTDLEHVSQLLHAAAGSQHLGVAALTGWLRQRIAAAAREGSNEELTRRLDSDADAVQVLTFHRSKGLEFPVVYCPFLWEPGMLSGDSRPIYFHDSASGDIRAIDVGLEGRESREHHHQHCVEERGEELRLAYVGLTRARHQAVAWWAGAWSARDSPLGRLLFVRDPDGNVAWSGTSRPSDATVLERFTEVAGAAPHAVSVEPARLGLPLRWGGRPQPHDDLSLARFDRSLDTAWRRTSYTAITAGAHDALVGAGAGRLVVGVDGSAIGGAAVASEPEEWGVTDEPAFPPSSAPAAVAGGEALAAELRAIALPLEPMAMGPQMGTVIHRVFEAADFDVPDLADELTMLVEALVSRNPGLPGCPPSVVGAGLALAIQTPLGGPLGSLSLSRISRRDRLDELEFELPLAGGDQPTGDVRLATIAGLLRDWLPADDPLTGYAERLLDPSLAGVMRGFLTGTIDLVLRVGDSGGGGSLFPMRPRYFVLDYKTNWLSAPDEVLSAWHYRPEALAVEMQRSHYALQALLYSAALHRYLRWRVPDYDPQTDLGGVYYLFIRGMLGTDTPATTGGRCGVCSWHPPAGLIAAISEALDGS